MSKRTTEEDNAINVELIPMFISWQDVEKRLGRKVNRRKKYRIIDGEVCDHSTYTQTCSGCFNTWEGYDPPGTKYDKNGIALGFGCECCGYHGKVRESTWYPISMSLKMDNFEIKE